MTDPAVAVDHVTKEFRMYVENRNSLKERFVRGAPKGSQTFKALSDVSLSIHRGSTFGLIGHNGSGKSTMLKLLAGVYRPTSGTIRVDGRVSALLELGAGFHGELTGRENIRLNGAILGYSKKQIDRQMDEIIEFADIGEFIDAPVKVYSSGMYVRLGFAVAVMLDPEILIVDEIIAVGDEEFQRRCFDHLFKLRAQGVTIALVTHSMGLAKELCDDAIWLDHGVEMEQGPVAKIIGSYLDSVNRAEAEADPSSRTSKPVDGGMDGHRGSGEARVTEVAIQNDDGEPVAFVCPGDSVVLSFRVSAVRSIPSGAIGLGIITENGLFISGASSNETNIAYDIPVGESVVQFHLPYLILQPGTYQIAASVTSKGHTFDYVESAGQLIVRPKSGDVEPGYFRLQGNWSDSLNTVDQPSAGENRD